MKYTIEQFRQKFSEAIDEDLIIQLEPNESFKNLESWDSFSGMIIIAMIDEEFGITIRAEEMARINTLEELYDLLLNRI
jgi:acyl carrier protein